jgi:hypothetical protein
MANDDSEVGEAVWTASHNAAVKAVDDIRASLAPHVTSQEQLDEATRLALKKIADPAAFAQESAWIDQAHKAAQAELARREGERQQKIQKLRDAYWNFEKLPHSREKLNYQTALWSMLKRYGEQP